MAFKVKFVLTDDELYFNGNNDKLTSDDYEISSVKFNWTIRDAVYDQDQMKSTEEYDHVRMVEGGFRK